MTILVGDKMRPRQYCLFLLMVLIPLSEQKRDFYFHLDSCDTESANPKICEVNCTLTKKGDVLGVSGFMNILEPADGGGLSIELKIRKLGGDKYLTFINQTVPDACVYLKGNSRLNIVQIGIDELIKSGKVPGCPVEAGVYYIKDYYISPEYFPPILPEADWNAKGAFFGVKNGVRAECARFSITGSIRLKKNSLWNRFKNPT
ncbi:unnamed protein product [Hermetia illucens]|uniref:MD-2-related lipid-recognition domain-containing protein n=2 Tax=Hermetia illucens TaxID=343691 RepID=A0A7R8UJK7_HERIL|nr:unnamed protein product [Hermetia illucens]